MSDEQTQRKPGEAALQNMQLLKKESTVFKVPKVPKKRNANKSKVLDENLYVEVSLASNNLSYLIGSYLFWLCIDCSQDPHTYLLYFGIHVNFLFKFIY